MFQPSTHFLQSDQIHNSNPSGNTPVSFKFACFKRSLLSQIDYTRLHSLLTINNQMYNNNLMIIEAQDTDLFYSDKIFSE